MAVRVLVVDDSAFYRRRVIEALSAQGDIVVAGEAGDGLEAVEKARALRPDLITMDVTMPRLSGVEAVKRIIAERRVPIIMFSSLTTEGAKATLEALEAGAADFVPKHPGRAGEDPRAAMTQLCTSIRLLVARAARGAREAPAAAAHAIPAAPQSVPVPAADIELIVIGTSTGGPVALQQVLPALPAAFSFPVLVVQHMPALFTKAFAERLDKSCACAVKEAADGERMSKGVVYVAPGGQQTTLQRRGGALHLRVGAAPAGQIYKPCLDVVFSSAADACPGKVLGVVLTGMGADGKEGAARLKAGGSALWAQDEHSSVIFGMPKAVIDAGYADRVMPLSGIGPALSKLA